MDRWTNLEGVELDIGVAMGESLDHALDGFLGTVGVARHLVAYLDDGAPVLRRQVLVSRLGCEDAVSESGTGGNEDADGSSSDAKRRLPLAARLRNLLTTSSNGPAAAARNMAAAAAVADD
jgi:hypothetical protein